MKNNYVDGTIMGLLNTIKSLAGKVRGAATEEERVLEGDAVEQQASGATDPATLRQVSYFKIGRDGHTFVRAYAPELKIRDHELYILVGGEARVISSRYYLTAPEHLERAPGGDVLFMFVYDRELYPLPRGRSYFNRKFDLQVRYAPSAGGMAKLVADRPEVQQAQAALNKEKEAFAQARDQVRNFAASQGQFFQQLPPLALAMAEGASQTNQVNQTRVIPDEGTLVRILPAEPGEIAAKTKKSRFRKKREKRQTEELEKAVDHLFRPTE